MRKRRSFVIAFTGSHCVGKTTLMNELAKLLKKDGMRVKTIPEVARMIPKEKLGTFEGQKEVSKLIRNCIEECINNGVDIVLVDRSPFDTIYYTIFYMIDKQWTLKELSSVYDLIYDSYLDTLELIDIHVFVMRSDTVKLVDDGFRLYDERSRTIVDIIAKLLNVLNCDSIPTLFVLPSGNVEKDARFIYDMITPYIKLARSDRICMKS